MKQDNTRGKALEVYREARGLSVMELARLAGVSRSEIYKIRDGKIQNPGVETLNRLEDALCIARYTLR